MFKPIQLLVGLILLTLGVWAQANTPQAPGPAALTPAIPAKSASKSTADHTQLEALKGPFKTGPEVTKACLSCHNEAATR